MTAAFQSFGISDNTKEMMNRLVIGVATMAADHFRKRGSRLSRMLPMVQLENPFEDLRTHAKSFQSPEGEYILS